MLFLLIVLKQDDSRRHEILGCIKPSPGGVIVDATVCRAADFGADGENSGIHVAISRRPPSRIEVLVFPHVREPVALASLCSPVVRMSALPLITGRLAASSSRRLASREPPQ